MYFSDTVFNVIFIFYVSVSQSVILYAYFHVLVYTACGDGIARTFDAKSGALKREFKGHEKAIYAIQVERITQFP